MSEIKQKRTIDYLYLLLVREGIQRSKLLITLFLQFREDAQFNVEYATQPGVGVGGRAPN